MAEDAIGDDLGGGPVAWRRVAQQDRAARGGVVDPDIGAEDPLLEGRVKLAEVVQQTCTERRLLNPDRTCSTLCDRSDGPQMIRQLLPVPGVARGA